MVSRKKEGIVSESIVIHRLGNGLTLIVEPMAEVSSAAFMFLVPSGAASDPAGRTGCSTVLSELMFRGAGEMDNRQLNDRLDSLGVQRSGGVSSLHSRFGGGIVGDKLLDVLAVYADVLRRPRLEQGQFELSCELAIQSLDSLEDDPRSRVSLLVHEKYLPDGLGRPAPGKRDELEGLGLKDVAGQWSDRFRPDGTILSVAGKVDVERLKEAVEGWFGEWSGQTDGYEGTGNCHETVYHEANEGAQVHIGVMYPSVHARDEDYYKALMAVTVLSGGMSSRLFTEVREKRGLCYSVGASHAVIGPYGAVQCYLGSSPEQAQEGLDVMLGELAKLSEGISEDELARAKVGLRASLIMQGESSGARAQRCGGDYYHLGRVRSLSEIEEAIKKLTVDEVVEHAREYQPKQVTVATIGPKELKVGSLQD